MTEPTAPSRSGPFWEQKVLDTLGFFRWPWLPASPAQIAAVVLVVVAIVFGPHWLAIPVAAVSVALAVTYWLAFAVKVVRQFRVGYREEL